MRKQKSLTEKDINELLKSQFQNHLIFTPQTDFAGVGFGLVQDSRGGNPP